MAFPAWWEWEIELTPHVEKRMVDRDFTKLDLREMLQRASALRPGAIDGRFVVETTFRGRRWEVVVEPDQMDHLLVVVTAYGIAP